MSRKIMGASLGLVVAMGFSAWAEKKPTAMDRAVWEGHKWESPANGKISEKNLTQLMNWFVDTAHPLGSAAQERKAQELMLWGKMWGAETQLHAVTVKTPNLDFSAFGGKNPSAPKIKDTVLNNVILTWKGAENCSVVVGSHYDTKFFREEGFQGANDGGSSTVLAMDLLRALSQTSKKHQAKGTWWSCDVNFVFFDGEESMLNGWSDGQEFLGFRDNLYGSYAYVRSLKKQGGKVIVNEKPMELAIIIDMVGHKNQDIFASAGSHPDVLKQILAVKRDTKISSKLDVGMEDDHLPFHEANVTLLHLIDFNNTAEHHKPTDTIGIISFKKLATFGDVLVEFLKAKRL